MNVNLSNQKTLRLAVKPSQFSVVTMGLATPGRLDITFTLGAAQPVAPSPSFLVNCEVQKNLQ
jgi:hypothetical protein